MRDILQYVHSNKEYEKGRLLSRAWGYSEIGMHKEALDECRKLVRLDIRDVASLIELGLYCEDSGETDKAIKYYKYAIKIFPECSRLYLNLGYCFEKYKKRDDMAAVCYEKALELDPNDMWALNNTAVILCKKGKRKEAVSYYEKSYEACRQNGVEDCQVMHNLAWSYYRLKDYDKAMVLYQRLLNNEECDKALTCYSFGCVNYRTGSYRRARELFDRAILLCPDNRYYKRAWKAASKKVC